MLQSRTSDSKPINQQREHRKNPAECFDVSVGLFRSSLTTRYVVTCSSWLTQLTPSEVESRNRQGYRVQSTVLFIWELFFPLYRIETLMDKVQYVEWNHILL